MSRPQRGQLLVMRGESFIVLKVGRGRIVYSVWVYGTDGKTRLIAEANYWLDRNEMTLGPVKPSNRRWAKEYCDAHPTPDI